MAPTFAPPAGRALRAGLESPELSTGWWGAGARLAPPGWGVLGPGATNPPLWGSSFPEMSHETPEPTSDTPQTTPSFPDQAAPQILPLEAARIRSLDSSPGLPRWQPEDGDFN